MLVLVLILHIAHLAHRNGRDDGARRAQLRERALARRLVAEHRHVLERMPLDGHGVGRPVDDLEPHDRVGRTKELLTTNKVFI